jgi:hypothetical protein
VSANEGPVAVNDRAFLLNELLKMNVMAFNFFNRRISNAQALFHGHYVDAKVFYAVQFNMIPAISFIGDLDGSKAFKYIHDMFQFEVAGIYQHNYFDHDKKEIFFNNTVFVFKDKRMIELAGNYFHVLHTIRQYKWAQDLARELAAFKVDNASANENRVIGFARNNTMN